MEETEIPVMSADEARAVSTERQEVTVELAPPEDYVYVNVAGIALSPFDVRLNFSEMSPGTEPKKSVSLNSKVGLVMAPEHAASLAFLLFDHLSVYEHTYGQLRHRRWSKMRKRIEEKMKPEPPSE